MSLCPEHAKRAAMTDQEFWEHVFGLTPEEEQSWAEYRWAMDGPDLWAILCARCGSLVEVDEESVTDREHDAFCDDCASEMMLDPEETR